MRLKHRIKAALIAWVFGVILSLVAGVVFVCSGQSWWWVLAVVLLCWGAGPILGFLMPRPVLAVSRHIEIEIEV